MGNFGTFFTCDYYAQAPTELCTQTDDMFMNFGKTAREACCACNGNHDCGRVCDVVVMFKTCGGANSTTEAWPTATICDKNGNCQYDYYLDPREDILWANPLWPILAGTKYAWRVPTSMFDSYASSVTLISAQDGVCIEDVWIDYKLVNDPSTPIFLSRSEDEFPGEDVVSQTTFDAPDCRQPSVAPTVEPSPAPTSMPTEQPSRAPLECVEIRNMYTDLVTTYETEQQVCQDTEDLYVALATSDGCDYGVLCARCDRLSITEPNSAPEIFGVNPDAVQVATEAAAALELVDIRGPQGTIMYFSNADDDSKEIFVHDEPYYRRTCVEYKP